jgi:Protein of unknown function (DUF3034)
MNSSYSKEFKNGRIWLCVAAVLIGLVFALGSSTPLHAQALGWEGETGIFVTPLAYTASAENQKIHAVTAYHFFSTGPVIGDFHEASIELGIGKRFEFGYTHEFHTFGNDMTAPTNQLSPLWQNGFEIFNGKFQVVPENYAKTKWVPAISTGFIARTDVRNVGNYMVEKNAPAMSGKTNGDIYVVATKVVPIKPIPIVLNFGVRGTNAELWGMGGNAPDWQARAFGAVAFVFKGPSKSTIIVGSEASQQPHHPYMFDGTQTGYPVVNIPTTLTYCVRFIPSPKHKLNFDFGIAQVAGNIATGVNLQARHQAGFQMSYGF